MRKFLREVRNSNGALSMVLSGINLLPFAGLLLLLSTDTAAVVFGIVFLVLGLITWTFSY